MSIILASDFFCTWVIRGVAECGTGVSEPRMIHLDELKIARNTGEL